jgi:wyosine [tRNA(Phe)-imidazoG37] synthetase (radical SAM superfamily)
MPHDIQIVGPKKVQDHSRFIWNNQQKIVYGPINSRRLGSSLGINLFPCGKICTFRCVYCDCKSSVRAASYAGTHTLVSGIQSDLRHLQTEGVGIDCITFAGNGEPTDHPHFAEIMDAVLKSRDECFPHCPVAVFTNCTNLQKPQVCHALNWADQVFLKLDAADDQTFCRLNRPRRALRFGDMIDWISAFRDPLISTAVIAGPEPFSNIQSVVSTAFARLLDRVGASKLYLYSIDYPSELDVIEPASVETLVQMACRIWRQREMPITVLTRIPQHEEVSVCVQ